jgi:dihydropyrimidinase
MIADIAVKNCKVVRPEGITSEGIAIKGEKIVAIADDANLPEASKTIDAKGNFVLPGIIDNHTHGGGAHPLDIDTRVDSAAAIYGGVTTVNNMIGVGTCFRRGSYAEVLDEWIEKINNNTFTDCVLTPVIMTQAHIDDLPLVAGKWGITTFKMFLAYKGEEATKSMVSACDDGMVYVVMKEIKALGSPGRLLLHCENIDIIQRLVPAIRDREKRKDLAAWTDSRPGFCEGLDVERAASIAKITKAPIYVVHLSSSEGIDAVAKAQAEGVDIVAETCPPYLTLTKFSPIGPLGKVNPPLRDEENMRCMWEALQTGVVTCMGTDNCSYTKAEKADIWQGYPGYSCIENYLPIMLSEGVNKGRLTLEKLVEVCSSNNAKAMGIYPQKGTIRIGSDADLVIVDLNKKVKLSAETDHQYSDSCIYEGWEVTGYPVLTMLRGHVVMQDGKLLAQPGAGRYLPRSM